ncbi:MAG: sulfotransferase [Verrucomicrobia bacterium]|nr:sulfotransferase [Verrucomicrobiota bacterium]
MRVSKTACAGDLGIYPFAATMKLKRQRLVSQSTLSRMLQTAEEAWKRREFRQCIGILERASRLDPANSEILLQLGRVHGLCYDYAAAENCFEKAVRVAPNKTETLAAAGLQSRDFRSYGMAERFFQRAVEQKNAAPETLINLAELYERLRRLEDAARLVDHALQLDGACASELLARARLERQTGRPAEAEKLLRSFLPNAEQTIRIRGWYELGALLDRQGRYDEAMTAFLEAKALLRPDAAPYAAGLRLLRARLKEMTANISVDMLQRWLDLSQAFQPLRRLALLCGHPRSGTTLLEQVLDSHAEIVSAEETEIFHDDAYVPLTRSLPEGTLMLSVLESAQTSALQQSRANYFRSMELSLGNPIAGRLLVDKNPSLTFLIPALIRVFPETKFLLALRDPRDVCLSCFMQPFVPLGQTTSAYLSLESTVEEYAHLMGIWRTLAPLLPSPYLEVRYEDMVEDLESVARRVLEFLDVPWDARVLGFDEHARQKLVRSPTYADVVKPVFKTAVGRWRNYQKYLEPHLEKLAPFVKAFGYDE